MEIDRGSRGRALFTALGYGWAWFGAFGLLDSMATLLLSLVDLPLESGDGFRHDAPTAVYGFEMGLAGVIVGGATLLCAILFLRRIALFRGLLEVCLWLQLAMLISFNVLHIQHLLRFRGSAVSGAAAVKHGDFVVAYITAISTVYQASGMILLIILSLVFVRDASLKSQLKGSP